MCVLRDKFRENPVGCKALDDMAQSGRPNLMTLNLPDPAPLFSLRDPAYTSECQRASWPDVWVGWWEGVVSMGA